MKFRTKYERNEVFTDPGDPIRIIYGAKYDKNHNLVVEEKSKENFYAYINSFADSVDINVLVARFINGDREALIQRAGAYIDISDMPTNLNDFIALSQSGNALWNTLDVATKEKFNNNVMEFVSQIGSKEWNEILNTSEAANKKEFSDERKKASKKMKDAIKPNSVYGDQTDVAVDDTPSEQPVQGGIYLNE